MIWKKWAICRLDLLHYKFPVILKLAVRLRKNSAMGNPRTKAGSTIETFAASNAHGTRTCSFDVTHQTRRLKLPLDREKQNPTCLSKKVDSSERFMDLAQLFSDSLLMQFQNKYLLNSWQKWTFLSKHNQYNRDVGSLHSPEKAPFLKSRTTLHQTTSQVQT